MCSTQVKKLNRSSSESDLNFTSAPYNGNSSLQSCAQNLPLRSVIKRTVVVEEIIPNFSSLLNLNSSLINNPFIGRSVQNLNLHYLENSSNQCDSWHYKHLPELISNDLEQVQIKDSLNLSASPMDVDDIYGNDETDATNLPSPLTILYPKMNLSRSRLNIKKRTKITDSDESFLAENTIEAKQKTNLPKPKRKITKKTCFIVALILVLFLYLFFNSDNTSDIKLYNIQRDLKNHVYKQEIPLNIVIKNLEERDEWSTKRKLLGFVGASGVGKTYLANVMKKHFKNGLLHEMYGVQINYKSERDKVLKNLKSCCLNLIILDDLKKKDTIDVFAFVRLIPSDQFALILSIFDLKSCDDNLDSIINPKDIENIKNEFEHSGLNAEVIIFEDFDRKQIKSWIEIQLVLRNVTKNHIDNIVNNILSYHDVSLGLKGLDAKMSLEIEKLKH